MVGLGRFELPTSPLSGVRSNQLSYRPGFRRIDSTGVLARSRPANRLAGRSGALSKGFEDTVEHAKTAMQSWTIVVDR